MSDKNEVLAWHFLPDDRNLQWGSRELVVPGKKITVEPPLVLCHHGLHASEKILDALDYAPGSVACRVLVSGQILNGSDKLCATERTCLWMVDGAETLHEFACWCAEEVLLRERSRGREPNKACWEAIRVKRAWLSGLATDIELATALAAAQHIAWSTSQATAWAAAWATAWAAAADWATSWAIAQAAAWAAARAADWAAAREKQESRLVEMIESLNKKENACDNVSN